MSLMLRKSNKTRTVADMTNTLPMTGHVVVRSDEWLGSFDLNDDAGIERLRRHVESSAIFDEPIGEAWHISNIGGPDVLTLRGARTPFDDNDYALASVDFVRDDGAIVVTVTYRVDGRS